MAFSAVVTGCGTGIGRAIFDRLLANGWLVVGLEIQPELAEAARRHAGDRGGVVLGDVAETADLEAAADLAQTLAPLKGWVNNAGLAIGGNLHESDLSGVQRLFAVDLLGVFWGSAVAVRRFLAQKSGGAIVNISSIHASGAFPGGLPTPLPRAASRRSRVIRLSSTVQSASERTRSHREPS